MTGARSSSLSRSTLAKQQQQQPRVGLMAGSEEAGREQEHQGEEGPQRSMQQAADGPAVEEELVVGYAFLPKKMGTMGRIVLQAKAPPDPADARKVSASGKDALSGGGGCDEHCLPRVRFTPIDVDRPLEEQGPFDAILHKLSEDVVHRETDPAAARRLDNLEAYVARHPRTVLIEHPRDIARIVSRTATCEALQALSERAPDAGVRPPRFFVLEAPPRDPSHSHEEDALAVAAHARAAVAAAPFSYPVIGKPVAACGTSRSHQLVVLGGEEGVAELLTREALPMVIQEYANHDGVLLKVYVLGQDTIRVFERRSLPNLGPHARSVAFNSQRPYPQRADFEGSGGEASDDDDQDEDDGDVNEQRWRGGLSPEGEARIKRAARLIGQTFNLEVFGFDVLVPVASGAEEGAKEAGEWLVVDVNYFPSFKEVKDFPHLIHAFLRKRVRQHRASPLLEQE